MTDAVANQPRYRIGLIGSFTGATALLIVLIQLFAGPFAPQQRVGVTIGEIVVDIHETVKKKLKREQLPKPEANPWDLDDWLVVIVNILAVAAILAGCVGLALREQMQSAVVSIALGATTVFAQLFVWTVLIIAGAIILFAIITNFGEIIDKVGGNL